MKDDRDAQSRIDAKLDAMRSDTTREFSMVRSEVQARHAENQAGLAKLYSGLWRVALAILGALALNYLAAHGFKIGP